MARVPAFARAFAGRWRIVEMDVWEDVVDEVEERTSPSDQAPMARSPLSPSAATSMSATVPETDRLAPSSPGRAPMTASKHAAVAGL